MAKAVLLIAFLFCIKAPYAQQGATDSSGSTDYVRHLYNTYRNDELAIYTGIQYYGYSPAIEGIPFFQSAGWQKGTVHYDGIVYQNISMKYDLVRDELVVTANENTGIAIAPFGPRITRFSFGGNTFVRLGKHGDGSSLPEGFYQQLAQGKMAAYAKKTKLIKEKLSGGTIYQNFDDKVKYYVFRDGVYHLVKNAGDFFSLFREYKKEIQQYLAANKLKYRNDPEKAILMAVLFYNKRTD